MKSVKYFEQRVDKRPKGAESEDVLLARAVPTICDMYFVEMVDKIKAQMVKNKVSGVGIISMADVFKVLNDIKKQKFETDLLLT